MKSLLKARATGWCAALLLALAVAGCATPRNEAVSPAAAELIVTNARIATLDAKSRTVQASPGVPVGSLVARGEVALGFQQLSELIHIEGIDLLGPLPAAVQITTTFTAGLCPGSNQAAAVRGLLDFMASPAAAEAKQRQGMEPA